MLTQKSTELTQSMKETIQSAAQKLTGFLRRQFQAEVAVRYCGGSARRAERVLGWGREAVQTGLHELRRGCYFFELFGGGVRRMVRKSLVIF